MAFSSSTQAFTAQDQSAANQADIIKTMTFNIRVATPFDIFNSWGSRKKMVVNLLKEHDADIIALQEALNSQLKHIQKYMPEYSTYAAGRSNGKKGGESCPIMYRTDRFTLLDSGTFWFSNTPEKPSTRFGNFVPRICSWVQLIDNSSSTGLYIYNLHLDNLSQSSRAKSVKQLANHIAARKTNEPFIVMGDFNMTIDNPAMKYLRTLKTPQMKDAWLSVNAGKPDMGTYHSFTGKQNGPKIDHIPLSENIRALQVTVDQRGVNGKFPSDHYPVIAKILLKKPLVQLKQVKNAKNIFPELKKQSFKKLGSF